MADDKSEEAQTYMGSTDLDTWCDVCVGKGDPGTGKPCICGGTGRAIDAVVNLRRALYDLERTSAELRAALDNLRTGNNCWCINLRCDIEHELRCRMAREALAVTKGEKG
jgi:hypothetical protein